MKLEEVLKKAERSGGQSARIRNEVKKLLTSKGLVQKPEEKQSDLRPKHDIAAEALISAWKGLK